MLPMNIESGPSSAQLDQAQSLLNTKVDTSQVDNLLGAVGQQGALDGVKGQLAGLQGQASDQLAQVGIFSSDVSSQIFDWIILQTINFRFIPLFSCLMRRPELNRCKRLVVCWMSFKMMALLRRINLGTEVATSSRS